jgi:dGTPase
MFPSLFGFLLENYLCIESVKGLLNWKELLSTKRYRGDDGMKEDTSSADIRSPFTKDADRIVFSPAFRRLQDKTQVHLGPRVDVVRTRLTHTLEASSIGRSLGAAAGASIIRKHGSIALRGTEVIEAGDFGAIVAAGCLAHDIGNTPFGHAGEDAIQHWFREQDEAGVLAGLSDEEKNDLECFEGNAQGFRILTRLDGWRNKGGLRLTAATLGAFAKYPRSSTSNDQHKKSQNTKFNYLQDDERAFRMIAGELGLRREGQSESYYRHPLAYLVEAADDISYLIADLEDGVESEILHAAEVEELLTRIVPENEKRSLGQINVPKTRVAYLRAKAIGILIDQVTRVFLEKDEPILGGEGPDSLLSIISSSEDIRKIKKLSQERLYKELTKLTSELAGYEVVHGLLEIYVEALLQKTDCRDK